jgi:D-serine deaminase-like pyridoxal phosphate-dependent protein
VLALLELLEPHGQLRFKGLQAYHGGVQHVRGHAQRRDAAQRAAARTAAIVAALAQAGVACATVTGGGTGSVEFDLTSGVYTEVQPGSYVFMDGDYGRNEASSAWRFEQSLFIASTVMSVGSGDRIVLDAGLKSIAVDSGLPGIWHQGALSTTLVYAAANDEHGIVHSRAPADAQPADAHPALGSQLLLVPGHCDPTLNLHDTLIGVRDGRVEGLWPIAARGLSR